MEQEGGRHRSEVEPDLVYARKPIWRERIGLVSGLEFCAGDAALPDDREECADGEFRVIRNRDCDRPCVGSMLHHHMTAAPPDFAEAVFFKDPAGISTGKNSQFTHAPLRSV